jgi:hypothetical protein
VHLPRIFIGFILISLHVRGEDGQEVSSVIIGMEFRLGRSVVYHSCSDLGYSCAAAFCQFKLFQEIAYPSVPVISDDDSFLFEVIITDGRYGAGEGEDIYMVFED